MFNRPYVLVQIGSSKKFCSLRPEGILNIEHLDLTFDPPAEELVHEHLNSAFGNFFGEPERLKVRFNREITPTIKEKLWHPRQTCSESGQDGYTIMSFWHQVALILFARS